jgi:hypothetical protein
MLYVAIKILHKLHKLYQGRSKDKTIIVAALGSMIWPKIKATHHTIIWWWWKLQKFLVVVGKMEHEHWLGMTMNKIKYG